MTTRRTRQKRHRNKTAKKTGLRQRGRPSAIKDESDIARKLVKLGNIQATRTECLAVLGISESTLLRLFKRRPDIKEAYENAYLHGHISLRRNQFKLAKKSAPMAIQLGILHLGQTKLGIPAMRDQDPKVALANLLEEIKKRENEARIIRAERSRTGPKGEIKKQGT